MGFTITADFMGVTAIGVNFVGLSFCLFSWVEIRYQDIELPGPRYDVFLYRTAWPEIL